MNRCFFLNHKWVAVAGNWKIGKFGVPFQKYYTECERCHTSFYGSIYAQETIGDYIDLLKFKIHNFVSQFRRNKNDDDLPF